MTREQALDIITNSRDGPPEGSARHRDLMAFLETAPECKRLYEQQQVVWESLELWENVEPSAGFDRRLLEQIDRRGLGGSWFARLLGNWRPSFAVGLAGLVLAAAMVIQRRAELVGEPQVIAGDAEYAEQLDRALDDIEMLAEFDVLPLGG